MTDVALALLIAALSAVSAAGGAWAAVRADVRELKREVNRLGKMIDPNHYPLE
jgi:hypothetical protein